MGASDIMAKPGRSVFGGQFPDLLIERLLKLGTQARWQSAPQRCASRSIAQNRKSNRPCLHWHRCINRGYSCAWATSGWYGCRAGRAHTPYAASAAELHALLCDAAWPYDTDARQGG